MAKLSEMIANGQVCSCLRAKTMFYDTDDHENAPVTGPFWCAHTQTVLGPDDKPVEEEACRPGRSCCETV